MTKYFIFNAVYSFSAKDIFLWKVHEVPCENFEYRNHLQYVSFPILASTKITSLIYEHVLECYPVISIKKFFRKECTVGCHQSNLAR